MAVKATAFTARGNLTAANVAAYLCARCTEKISRNVESAEGPPYASMVVSARSVKTAEVCDRFI